MSVKRVNDEEFFKSVISYTASEDEKVDDEFLYLGKIPAIITFTIPGSEPCEKAIEVMEELSKEYKGKVDFIEVDINESKSVGLTFGIQSVPSCLLISTEEDSDPMFINGIIPKEGYVQAIEKELLKKK